MYIATYANGALKIGGAVGGGGPKSPVFKSLGAMAPPVLTPFVYTVLIRHSQALPKMSESIPTFLMKLL